MGSQDSPNIVFIHAESMDGRKMGCMGHAPIRNATPNLDSLARRGTLFTNAYSNCPVCNPSRASMWTGKYPHHYDCWNNHEGIRKDVPTFRTAFENAGYRTATFGPLDYTYGKHSIRDRVGSWTRTARIHRPISRTPMPQVMEDEDLNGWDWQNTYRAIDWLRESADSDRPFMLYLTTGLVHPAFNALKKHMDRIDADKIEIPPGLEDVKESDHPVDLYQRITKNCDRKFSEALVREMRHIYFAMIAALDDMVGRVLQTLGDLGLNDSTYVIFSSDHGEMAGEQNQVLKRTMYESSVHEPLIVTGPDVCSGSEIETPVSLIDLYPTFLDMAGLEYGDVTRGGSFADSLDGQSLISLLTGGTSDRRDWVFSEYNGDRCCTGMYMLRRGPWKYIKYVGYEPQLFNLENDPWETQNVAAENPNIVNELDTILTENFDPDMIHSRTRQYDRESFRQWREQQLKASTYRDMMAKIYSGYDRLCIEDIMPWTDDDEARIEAWLAEDD
ncbi:MAG: sulfatase [Candidatus Brocadiia bacterium]